MENIMSKSEDVTWLLRQLKCIMGDRILVNGWNFGDCVQTVYCSKENYYTVLYGLDVNIKYNKDEFLSISVGEIYLSKLYEEKLEILDYFCAVLSNIVDQNGKKIGNPLASFSISKEDYQIPHLYWGFNNIKEDIFALEVGAFFDDAKPENLIIYKNDIADNKVFLKKYKV